jgi:hypothetical protein
MDIDIDLDRRVLAGRCYQVRRDGVKGDSLDRCHTFVLVASIRCLDDCNSDA